MKGDAPFAGALKGDAPFAGALKGNAPFTGALKGIAPFAGALKGNAPFAGALKSNAPFAGASKGDPISPGACVPCLGMAPGEAPGTTQGDQVSRYSSPERVTKEGFLASPLVQPRGIQCGATLA